MGNPEKKRGGKEKNLKVIIAQSWEEIFPKEVRTAAFKAYVKSFIQVHNDQYLSSVVWEENNGELKCTITRFTSIELLLLKNGDVLLRFLHPNQEPNEHRIEANIGNINHSYTEEDTQIPPTTNQIIIWSDLMQTETGDGSCQQSIKGKPASRAWFEIVSKAVKGSMPIRIGYRIYPENVVAAARKIRLEHPELFEVPTT